MNFTTNKCHPYASSVCVVCENTEKTCKKQVLMSITVKNFGYKIYFSMV